MPLDAEAEARGWIFDRLDDAVGRGGRDAEPGRDLLDRLVMAAVRLARVGVAQPFAHQAREQRVFVDPHFVRQVVGLVRRHRPAVLQRAGHLRGDVLHQRAAARDVQDLDAAADREDRQVAAARLADERELELVARRIDVHHRRMSRLAVAGRRDVLAAGEQQAVDCVDRLVHGHRMVDQMRTSPPTWRTA